MSGDAVARFFDAIAGRYDRAYALPGAESRRRMTRLLRALPPSPSRILDLGVGTGRELTALLDAGHLPTGVDSSRAMLVRCAKRGRPVPLVEADFWAPPLPFDDESFDAAIALHGTLCHPGDDGALDLLARELARLVHEGGKLVAEVPSIDWLDHLPNLPDSDDRRIVRTGSRTCLYEDRAAGASVAARLFDEIEWHAALDPFWSVDIETLGTFEWLVVAERR